MVSGRWHRVEDTLDPPGANEDGQALEETHPAGGEGWERKCLGDCQRFVGKQRKGKPQSIDGFTLVLGALTRQPIQVHAKSSKVGISVAKGAGLRGATPRAGNEIPVVG